MSISVVDQIDLQTGFNLLDEQQQRLDALTTEFNALNAQLVSSDIDAVLGVKTNEQEDQALRHTRIVLQGAIERQKAIIDGLRAKIEEWRENDAADQYRADIEYLLELAAPTLKNEARLHAAAREFIEVSGLIRQNVQEFERTFDRIMRYRQQRQMPTTLGLAFVPPVAPYVIPEIAQRSVTAAWETSDQALRFMSKSVDGIGNVGEIGEPYAMAPERNHGSSIVFSIDSVIEDWEYRYHRGRSKG